MRRTAPLVVLLLSACSRAGSDTASPASSATNTSPIASALGANRVEGGPRAYVSNEQSGDVSVIDLVGGKVIATIPVGKRPRGIHASTDGKRVYVALSGSVAAGPNSSGDPGPADKSADGIGVIDTAKQALVGRLPSGSDPKQFSLSKDGSKLYISNEDAASMSIVDVATKGVEKTIQLGEEPEGVATSPDGRWVYVTSEAKNAVFVVDARTGKSVAELAVGSRPRAAAFLPDGTKAYVTAETGGTVSVVLLPDHHVSKTLKLEGPNVRPMGVAVAPDGRFAYITTGHGGTVVVVDTSKDEAVAQIPVGKRPWGIAVAPDGRTLYVANGPSDDVSVVDVATQKETSRIKTGSKPWGIAVVP